MIDKSLKENQTTKNTKNKVQNNIIRTKMQKIKLAKMTKKRKPRALETTRKCEMF